MSGQTEADRHLRVLVGFVIFGGLVAVACSVLRLLVHPTSFPLLPVLALAAVVVLADQVRVTIRIRSHHLAQAWVDVAALVALAFLPPAWVVLATAGGMAVSKALRRVAPMRLAFNVAKSSATAFVGGAVLLAFDADGSANTPSDLGVLALAFVAMTVLDELLANSALALASRTRIRDRFRANLDIRLLVIAGRFGLVAAVILLVGRAPELLYGVPVVIAVGHLWHERWVRTREERLAWQQLARTTEAFNGVDLDVVVQAAVTGGARLFSADELEVELWLGLDRRLVRGDADGVRYDGDPAQAPRDSMSVYAVPLHGYQGRRDIGAVRLRFRDEVRISDREEAMLASFAASLDTAIRNAAAYGQLDEATQAHAHAATHDPLTGLANRRELEHQLAEALSHPGSVESRIAVLLIDLKHFKEVNDTLGHLTGDRVLTQIAQRLADHVRPTDLVARFGGDEFVVVLRDAHRRERVEARAADLLRRLSEPVVVEGLPIIVEANAGLALAREAWENAPSTSGGTALSAAGGTSVATDAVGGVPTVADGDWVAEVMRRADVAMYQAKRSGRQLVTYAPSGDVADRQRLALAGQLPQAVAQRQFVLVYQPIVELDTGQVVGAEALARWAHPQRGELEPRLFLDLLERSSQLGEFTAAVLEEALTAANLWKTSGHTLSVSVNISPRSLLDENLPMMVARALSAHGIPAEQLCLELTETLAISQLQTVDRVLGGLRDLGVRLALDDFGTGFSSLSALSRIPVHQLKIDRSFVAALPADHPDSAQKQQALAVVRSTVQLGRALDLAVVAEGVETATQRLTLWELGCTHGQGFLFAAPLPADRLLTTLARGVDGRPGTLATPMGHDSKVIHLPRPRTSDDVRADDGRSWEGR
ncbi:MAG: bifunctional diguanylate cyclase/phosphodiesterase [Micromonosporaceae bacterium]